MFFLNAQVGEWFMPAVSKTAISPKSLSHVRIVPCVQLAMMNLTEEKMNNKEENKDKCSDCQFNDTSCPGGMWCTEYH